ncbi:MAG: hypothetical protein JXR49_22225 [Acidobacteria bacterium]|nr:hypothetical protein [Acidobacteriota bacterium]
MFKHKPGSRKSQTLRMLLFVIGYFAVCLGGTLGLNIHLTGNTSFEYEPFVYLFFTVAPLIIFLVPLLVIYKISREKRGITLAQLLSAGTGGIGLAVRIVRVPATITLILCLVPGLSAFIISRIFGGVPAAGILRASLIMIIIGIFVLCLGFLCSIYCKNAYSAAGCALLVIVLICLEPLWFGPVIYATPNASYLIQPSLLINPFVGLASAIDFDLFRTSPLYQICPIGQRKFEYPAYTSVGLFYLLVSLVLFWRSAAGIRKTAEP